MALSAVFSTDTWRLETRVWLLVVAGFAATLTFMTTPWLALAAVATITAAARFVPRGQPLRLSLLPLSPWLLCGLALAGYILAQTGWSQDPRATALSAGIVALLLGAIHVLDRALPSFPQVWLEHLTRSILAAFMVALLFLLFEELSNHAVKRFLFWPFQAARFSAGALTFDQAAQVRINPTSVKWNMPAVTFLLWPVLYIARLQLGARAWWVQVLLIAATGWLVVLSDHKTSVPAMIIAVLVYMLASGLARATRFALAALWLLAFVAVIPIVQSLYSHELHREARVAPTLAARIVLWEATAREIPRHPVFGIGASASDLVNIDNDRAGKLVRKKAGKPPHPHNIYLQSLSELGIVGASLFALLGLFVLREAARSPQRSQPFLLAAFATVIATGSASFGLFEPWFMSAFALAAMVARIAVAYGGGIESEGSG